MTGSTRLVLPSDTLAQSNRLGPLGLALALFIVPWCAQAQNNSSGLDGELPAAPHSNVRYDLVQELDRYWNLVHDPARFHAGNASHLMHKAYREIFALTPESVDFASVDRDPHRFLQRLFEVTVALDARIAEFHAAGQFSEDMANAKRRILRGVRFLRETIALRTHTRQPDRLYEHGKPALASEVPDLYWNVDRNFQSSTLADLPRTFVLMCMGPGNISAAIARSANEDNMFSHLAIGYRSNREHVIKGTTHPPGTLFLLEALIETGVIIQPLSKHFETIDRDVIFAVRDRSRQAAVDAAADRFFEKAKIAYNAGEALSYDFSMGTKPAPSNTNFPAGLNFLAQEDGVLPDPDRYFCAAVGLEIFAEAGLDLFPATTQVNQGLNTQALFRSWGIDTTQAVTAPGDADVSTALYRVAEGVRIDGIENNHLQQVVLTQIFRWMDEDNYRLCWPVTTTLKTAFFSFLHRIHLDFGVVPDGMNMIMLQTLLALDKGSAVYLKALKRDNDRFKQLKGRPMVPSEMVAHLYSLRDTAPGRKLWLQRMPWILGTYQLHGRYGPTTIQVSPGTGVTHSVERHIGSARHLGTGIQQDSDLTITMDHSPRQLHYEIDESGNIRGYLRSSSRRPGSAPPPRKLVEQGHRVAGPPQLP